jgi:hypothetical protein
MMDEAKPAKKSFLILDEVTKTKGLFYKTFFGRNLRILVAS